MSKRVLLTGISGFIGSHVMEHILANTDWDIVGIASWKHKGTPERVIDSKYYQENKGRVEIVTHDLESPIPELTKRRLGYFDYIFNVASESHVDRSITDPVPFVQNNVNLILNMLEYAREVKPRLFMQISTDEVYGAAAEGESHREWSEIKPSNPYSASKAAQEAIAISYWRTYNVPVIITNTMNNFGERQDGEKYVCKIIKAIIQDEVVTPHINPKTKRPGSRKYLHARNHADALLFLVNHFKDNFPLFPKEEKPPRFNIVGDAERDNVQLIEDIGKILGKQPKYELVDAHSSRPGHDPRYSLDGGKLEGLGYTFPFSYDESLKKTVDWYVKNTEWII